MARIVMVCQPTEGGAAVHAAELARELLLNGHSVVVFCPDSHWLGSAITELGASWQDLPLRRSFDASDLRHIWTLRRAFRGTDLVILHSSKAGAVGRLSLLGMPKGARPRSIFTPHGWSWLVGGRLRMLYIAIERLLVHATDRVIAVSDADAAEGRRTLGERGRIAVIPNGIDETRFFPLDAESKLDSATPLIVVVGRLADAKGQDIAIRALARMTHRNARLILVGDGPRRERLVQLAVAQGVESRVNFVGTADPTPYYRSADVVLVPSRWDACSLVTLEALATGSAVVATDHVGAALSLQEFLVIVRSIDPVLIAEAVDTLLGDVEKRQRMMASAPHAIVGPWTATGSLHAHIQLIHDLVHGPQEIAR